MATGLEHENPTINQIVQHINNKKSFLLEAGAGSGKTWSLIESLKSILDKHSKSLSQNNQKIVCITFTNVAKNEIIERIENNRLALVLTIHEFLWHVISPFQVELRQVIVEFNQEQPPGKKIEDLDKAIQGLQVMYTQYGRAFDLGQITHDDVLEFSSRLFKSYPKLSRIVADKYPYIFIDEYQDTDGRTVDLLIDRLLANNPERIVIGFFGDSMQKIYNQGIGAITSDKLEVVTKADNFRCSIKVIHLLNNIRPALQQKPSGKNVEGNVTFFHSNRNPANLDNYKKVIEYLRLQEQWDLDKTKILMLTHRGIAGQLDYSILLKTYTDHYSFGRERLFEKEEAFSDLFLNRIENLVSFYSEKKYGDFIHLLGKEGFKIKSHKDKLEIKRLMDQLDEQRSTATIGQVLNYIFSNHLITKPQRIIDFEETIENGDQSDEGVLKKKRFYDALMKVKYQEVANLYRYIEDQTPFSTKHNVKGAEYENVLVVIDDASWNQYNFAHVFGGNRQNPGRYSRSLNLLYVCCSRAKDNLALLSLSAMDAKAMARIAEWFGDQNVLDVSTL